MASVNLTFPDPVSPTPRKFPGRSAEHPRPNRCGSRLMPTVMLSSLGTATYADLPLTVEDLIADKGSVKLDLSLSYTNSEKGLFRFVPIGDRNFSLVPSQDNSDLLIGSLSLAYGLMRNTELYGRSSYLYSNARSKRLGAASTAKDNRLLDAWVGVNYRFKEDDATPALIGFVETAGLEEHQGTLNYFKSWAAGFTTYRAIDPVVFSLTAGYRFN